MSGADVKKPTVTIGIPIYKRLHYLPGALKSVAAQDYPEIDLLVSDNGQNGPELRAIVEEHYPRPFRIRRNEVSEEIMSRHFNQIVEAAEGEYFVLLCDDDEIGPRFVSSLVEILERGPEIGLAVPRVEVMDEEGRTQPREEKYPPEIFSGTEFVRMWTDGGYCFWNFVTVMGRTREIRETGGYPDMPTGDDDAVALKLALGRKVGFARDAVFRNRWYEASHGLRITPWELAADIKRWFRFLDDDPVMQDFAARHPDEWAEVRRRMEEKAWKTYRHRWKSMYRERMKPLAWLRAGFAMPFIPEYYRWLFAYLFRRGLALPLRRVRG